MNTDKMIKGLCAGALAGGLLLSSGVMAGVTKATGKATVTIPLTIVNTLESCYLTVNGQSSLTYPLVGLTTGEIKKHPAFRVDVSCQDAGLVKTAITAKLVSGGDLIGDDKVRVKVGTAATDSRSPLFWLETGTGQPVKLTGTDSDAVCVKEDTSPSSQNSCLLTPVTEIPPSSPTGDIGVIVQLNVVYPQ